MSEDKPVLLKVQNLKQQFLIKGSLFEGKRYLRAVDGVSFSIKEGETLGIVGESGCGKSTLARSVAQLLKPTEGSVFFGDKDLTKLSGKELLETRKHIQMIFQDPFASLNPRMTVGSIIAEPMEIYRKRGLLNISREEMRARVRSLMGKVGILESYINRYPHEFSGGQRQRIGIARALALHPKLILADEPVSALDVSIQSQILNLMKDLQDEMGLTYLFIAHDLAVIRYISTHIAVMYLGKIVEITGADELYDNPTHPYTQALLSAAPIPDPEIERKRHRIVLTGDIIFPKGERKGCCFYDRCFKRMERCAHTIPELKEIKPNHYTACLLCEE